ACPFSRCHSHEGAMHPGVQRCGESGPRLRGGDISRGATPSPSSSQQAILPRGGPAVSDAASAEEFASARDRHLFGPGPKRILSLDGGGVRGALTVAFLMRLEEMLDARAGRKIRLGDHFDLIGGTSTGALIAGCLALGYRAEEI